MARSTDPLTFGIAMREVGAKTALYDGFGFARCDGKTAFSKYGNAPAGT